MDLRRDQLLAIKASLIQLMIQLNEAEARRSAIKSQAAIEWLGTVVHAVKMIEYQIDIMLGLIRLPIKRLSWFKRFWAKLFPLAVRDEVDLPSWYDREERLAAEASCHNVSG